MYEKLNLAFLKLKKFINEYRELGTINYDIIKPIDSSEVIDLIYLMKFTVYDILFLQNFWNLGDVNRLINHVDPTTRKNEQIMVIPRGNNFDIMISVLKNKYLPNSIQELINKHGLYKSRGEVEYDGKYVQLIPNMVVKHKDEIILLRKINKESRLFNTVGCPGGHIDLIDSKETTKFREFTNGAFRELKEELGIAANDVSFIKTVNFIDPVKNLLSVSYYHLGITVFVNLEDDAEVKNMEPEKHEIIRVKCNSILKRKVADKLENWCLESLLHAATENLI